MKKLRLLIIGCFGLLVSLTAQAEIAYLYVFFHDDNSTGERFRTALPDMATCLKSLEHAKLPMPARPSGDYEVMGAMWCGTETLHRNYSATWWSDPTKKPSEN